MIHAPIAWWHLLIMLVVVFLILLLATALLRFLVRRKLRRSRQTPCAEIPEPVDRPPDPCLYSQSFLLKFFPGQPVTWDNPDIQLTELDGSPVSSDSLLAAHEYLIHATIHDASFNPAIGVAVTCNYQSFGFSGLVSLPVETNPDGSPKMVVIDIPGWGNAKATFQWNTPDVPGEFCLLVQCSHPADANTWNNLGQENTVVHRARRGERVVVQAQIANGSRERAQRVNLLMDTYEIPQRETELRLRTTSAAAGSREAGEIRFPAGGRRGAVRYAYEGRDALLEANAATPRAIPDGWQVDVGGDVLELAAGEERSVPVTIAVPADAVAGVATFNITSIPDQGEPGGITIRVRVEG
jgi:hypothetical protein